MSLRTALCAWVCWLVCCAAQADPGRDAEASTHPFPFHAAYAAGVIKPNDVSQAEMDEAVLRHHRAWAKRYLRDSGGDGTWVKYDNTDSTVSEAHGYGMVIAAYMADRATFDSMLDYFLAHPSTISPHLMAWKQTLVGGVMKDVEGADSATDGDLDIAYALLLADAQWGASKPRYKALALKVLSDILAHEVNPATATFTPGDWASGADKLHTRPSDFMTGHLLAFAQADAAHADAWRGLYDRVASIVNDQFANGSGQTGLMPDFMVQSGTRFVPVEGKYLESRHDGDFSYNACRTPWRLSLSAVVQGRNEMIAPLRQQASWIESAAGGRPTGIRAGYTIANGPNGEPFVRYDDLAFTAPFAVNAMLGGPSSQAWLNALWRSITGGDYGPKVDYFGDSIRMQVLITVSGNWWVP